MIVLLPCFLLSSRLPCFSRPFFIFLNIRSCGVIPRVHDSPDVTETHYKLRTQASKPSPPTYDDPSSSCHISANTSGFNHLPTPTPSSTTPPTQHQTTYKYHPTVTCHASHQRIKKKYQN
ncbi:hypothetical protein F5Y07DRAFT_311824 [Xylaria sp. FL0933]|nr:hypothetical protein F5Y07DRAFT_311824 [Xylaria sp. FL0933]